MKQTLLNLALLATFSLLGASCAKQEQSEFKMDSLEQEVTISSTVVYSTGVDVNGSNYTVVNNKPAAGRKVFIEVAYSEYKTGAIGNKIFETVTDQNGTFSYNIPTKSTGISATVRLEEFTDSYKEYEKMENGKPVFKTTLRSYSFSKTFSGLKPGASEFPKEIEYTSTVIDLDLYDESVKMTGNIRLAYEKGFRQGAFKNAKQANVEFTIKYPGETNTVKYGTTTDANGNYTISIPAKSLADGFTILDISVLGIGNSQFVHYTGSTDSIKIYGAYELDRIGAIPVGGLNFSNIIAGATYNLGVKNLLFTPYYNAGIASTSTPDKWESNLVGWTAGKVDESYNKTATISGRVLTPVLNAFGEAAYVGKMQEIILKGTSDPYKNLATITDAEGYFSIELPIKENLSKNYFSIALADDVLPFTFIDSKSKQTVLRDGKYSQRGSAILKEGAEWNELGDFYLQYTPSSSNTPTEWNNNLIGWYVSQVFNKSVQVTGKMLFAEEESYGIGVYKPQTRIVTIYDATNSRYFAVKTNTNGEFNFMIPLKDEKDQPSISINSTSFNTNEYVHYKKYNSSETQLLAGKYTKYASSNVKDSRWNQLGTWYMKFSTTGTAPSTFHKDLAGWFIKTDANNVEYSNSVNAQGKAFIAVETGYMTGAYTPAKGYIIKATIDGTTIEVLTDNSGIFKFIVPLKNAGDESTLAISTSNINVEDFKHWVDGNGKTKILEGNYNGTTVKEDDLAWNNLGTVYYKFTPSVKPDLWDTYTQYLAGWAFKKGYSVKTNVSGNILMAKENSFRSGSFTEAANIPVKILVNSTDTYVGVSKSDGSFSIPVLQRFEGDEESVSWNSITLSDNLIGKFVHFRKPASDVTERLSGNYAVAGTVKKSSAKWFELGTRYYTFNNTGEALNWSSNLAGWKVWGADQTKTYTVTGKIMKAVEQWKSGSWVATWVATPNATAVVRVDGVNYPIVTNSIGQFTLNLKCSEYPVSVKVSVSPDQISESAFQHYADVSENKSISISGTYYSANNYYNTVVNRDGDKSSYPMPTAAKMTFTPSPSVATYDASNWTSKIHVDE